MTLKDVDIKDTYWSGEDDLLNDFYIPCLSNSVSYDRSAGYFNSSILKYITEGLYKLIKNQGKIRLICSPKLSEEDINKINEGYNARDVIEENINEVVDELIKDINMPNIHNLFWLVKNNLMDIRLCIKSNDSGDLLFHEKFGVFKDNKGNIVSFMGSINESSNGWIYNEESFEVSYNWESAFEQRVNNKIQRFQNLWAGNATSVNTYTLPVSTKDKIINYAPEKPRFTSSYDKLTGGEISIVGEVEFDFDPRRCQLEAFENFKENNFVSLFNMATGSGKTLAALYSMSEINGWEFLLIIVPTMELIEQWYEDVIKFFPDYHIIKCSSLNSSWKSDMMDLVEANFGIKSVVISTYASAMTDSAFSKYSKAPEDKFAAIFDEVHNLGGPQTKKIMDLEPKYRIGLSATPQRNFDEEGTEEIINYFNNNNYKFSIADSIREGYLVEYNYYVYPVILNEDEWKEYNELTKKIRRLGYIENDDDENNSKNFLLMKRAEILKTAENKAETFNTIVNDIELDKRILIYLDSKEQISEYAEILDELNRDYFIYTGNLDSKKERPRILNQFKIGTRKILLAINCLDEGIDIPICDSAIFVSSSTSKRQFIQRRGRVLRKAINKNRAYIYDYFVLPDIFKGDKDELRAAKSIIRKEYERTNIIADDAINGTETKNKLDKVLNDFGLSPYSYNEEVR